VSLIRDIKDWCARFKKAKVEKEAALATPRAATPTAQPATPATPAAPSKPVAARRWDEAVHASCWDGSNASRRLMNLVSPHFSENKFREYLKWTKERGCDAAHVILINQADGEGAGYNCASNADHAKLARERIESLRREGFAIVPWLITDDSRDFAEDLFAHPEERIKALAAARLFDGAAYVVLGLEMDEPNSYPSGKTGWPKVAAALRKHYTGRIGVHHKSGNSFPFAGLGDIILGQLDPGDATPAAIAKQIKAIQALGKEAVGFEYARGPARDLAKIALDKGAAGVGNW